MILSEEYLLRQIYDDYVLIPTGNLIGQFARTLKLNESSYEILKKFEKPLSSEQLADSLKEEDWSEDSIQAVMDFVNNMRDRGILMDLKVALDGKN